MVLTCACVSAAHADAWGAFQDRCLGPVEEARFESPTDLVLLDTIDDRSEGGVRIYALSDRGKAIWVSGDGESGTSFCMIVGSSVELASLEAANEWADEMVKLGRYAFVPRGYTHDPIRLQSTQWREPKIEVSIQLGYTAEGASLAVKELDLEV